MIIVLGFGRSGTTWVSDIISKTMGGLILFEPLHPAVDPAAEQHLYSSMCDQEECVKFDRYINSILNGKRQHDWLIRNHLPWSIEETTRTMKEEIWKSCKVIGYKEIRANLMIDHLAKRDNTKMVFVIRNPLAVVASIKKRPNFWNEFSWAFHYNTFVERTFNSPLYRNHAIQKCRKLLQSVETEVEKYALMWAVTHAIALPKLKVSTRSIIVRYEDLYSQPFKTAQKLIRFLGGSGHMIHPAHIFTPSMTTHKTLQGLKSFEDQVDDRLSFFWENILNDNDISAVLKIVNNLNLGAYAC